ncbi:DNA polymerase, partial [Bartonella sp. CL26QHWL]|uniref:DNA polymerase n=1 Tax=Bartonella sp. CL26QHWL TaxID=3243520 RepID=UPI0035D09FCB
SIDCIIQCSRFLDSKTNFDKLNDIIQHFNNKVCILTPQHYVLDINEIRSYSDLRLHHDSPIKSFSVIDPDIKYLLMYKEHVGVLYDFKESRRAVRVTKFNPLSKYSKTTRVTVCFDIEAYFDPENDSGHTNIPYLCCACFVYDSSIGNVLEFEGRDCVAQMIEYVIEICRELKIKNIELIAQNGGAYEFDYIISSMYDPSRVKNILIRNNSFISFTFTHENVLFNVKDSYSFLLCSLSNAAKAFLDNNHDFRKTDFPHHEVRTKEDLERTYRRWRSVDTIIDTSVEKEKLLISSHHVINYDNDNVSRRLIDWSKEYCCNDVIVLAKVWLEFKNAVFDIFNSKVVDQTLTLAGLSFRLFQAHLDQGIILKHPRKEDYMNMRASLIGGRCISLNGIYENILCLDVKSIYPAAMAFYDQPYCSFRRVHDRHKDELGIYHVAV